MSQFDSNRIPRNFLCGKYLSVTIQRTTDRFYRVQRTVVRENIRRADTATGDPVAGMASPEESDLEMDTSRRRGPGAMKGQTRGGISRAYCTRVTPTWRLYSGGSVMPRAVAALGGTVRNCVREELDCTTLLVGRRREEGTRRGTEKKRRESRRATERGRQKEKAGVKEDGSTGEPYESPRPVTSAPLPHHCLLFLVHMQCVC